MDIGRKDSSFGGYVRDETIVRLQWQVSDHGQVSHPPFVFVPSDRQNISAAPGEVVQLRGVVADPDRNKISTVW